MVWRNRWTTGVVMALSAALPLTASALEVYKWTDEQGVVHYSGSPPPESVDMAALETFEVPSEYEAPAESKEDKARSLLKVAKELEESRLAREEARAEREAQARDQWQRMLAPPAYTYTGGYAAAYFYPQSYYPGFGYPHFGRFPHFGQSPFLHDPRMGPILNRGQFVPGVKFQPFQPRYTAPAPGVPPIPTFR